MSRGVARVILLVVAAGAGCARTAASPPDAAPAAGDDVVVTQEHWSNGLRVSVGDTFRVPRPIDHEEWDVGYAREIVRMLTPADRVRRPGPEGWRFEAVARGSTDVTVVGVVRPGTGGQPNVPKLVLQVVVR